MTENQAAGDLLEKQFKASWDREENRDGLFPLTELEHVAIGLFIDWLLTNYDLVKK